VGKPDGKRPLGILGRNGRVIKWIFKKWVGMDWIDLAQHGGRWWGVVSTVVYLQVP
jgi:hypothetical protein